MDTEDRIRVLAQHLGCDDDDIDECTYRDNAFEAEGGEFLVLTADEADTLTREQIEQSLWAFDTSFIMSHADPNLRPLEDVIRGYQEKQYEDANDAIRALIVDLDHFVEDAKSADGRGHFLAGYDGEEHELTIGGSIMIYIYQTN